MTRKILPLLIIAMLAGGIYAANAIGVGGEGLRFGRVGATPSKGGGGGGGGGCTGTSLAFTTPCNSMYVAIIH